MSLFSKKTSLEDLIREDFNTLLERLRPELAEDANFVVEDKEKPVMLKTGLRHGGLHSWGNTQELDNGGVVSVLYVEPMVRSIKEYIHDNLREFITHELLHQRGLTEDQVVEEEHKVNPFI